jgi:hypothetical protein
MRPGSEAVRWHPVIFVDASTVGAVRPVGQAARSIAWGSLEPSAVEIDDIPALMYVVLQHPPRQRMIALAYTQEAPERHHGIGDLAGDLVDHKIVHRAEVLSLKVIHCGSDDFVGGDQTVRFVGSDWAVCRSCRRSLHYDSPLYFDYKENKTGDLEVPKKLALRSRGADANFTNPQKQNARVWVFKRNDPSMRVIVQEKIVEGGAGKGSYLAVGSMPGYPDSSNRLDA